MDLMLNKIVNQWNKSSKEETCEDLAVLDGLDIARRRQGQATERPGQGENQVCNHEDVVPVMVVSGSDINPSSAQHSPDHADCKDKLWARAVPPRGEEIPQEDQCEPGT
jgi:hypothetical protein